MGAKTYLNSHRVVMKSNIFVNVEKSGGSFGLRRGLRRVRTIESKVDLLGRETNNALERILGRKS